MIIFCPGCDFSIDYKLKTWDESVVIPFVCPDCNTFFWIRKQAADELRIEADIEESIIIPPIVEGTYIYINNKEHEFFLERGTIIKRDHIHYRIKFNSKDHRINNKCVWVPSHWVMVMPEGL
ncbi:hypothetical protein LCGC14_3050400 [marine sediment metagenome]|uniref:Uncharacterized protein n=1 Tax=marine sediment metagenome TaxID=412755 RepID=A0A0F8WMB7_9ZZZZ